jgi:hypothetical protein
MTEAEYMADVTRRGGFYARSLPANCPNLTPSVEGFPGAGFPTPLRYELAPWTVAAHVVNPLKLLLYPYDQSTAVLSAASNTVQQLGDLPKPPAILGAILGLPPIVVTLLILFLAYGALRQAGFVPPVKKVLG